MNSRSNRRHLLAAVLVGILVGGGITTATPAGAEVSAFAATNWKKIWKTKLRPQADKRYYTKSASDAKYSTKAQTSSALANFYTKAQSDAKYAAAGSAHTKAEADARYVGKMALRTGVFFLGDTAAAAGVLVGDSITYGTALATAPTRHYIPLAGPVPAECPGTAAAPDALPGHLCVFETGRVNASVPLIFNVNGSEGTSAMGSVLTATSTAGGNAIVAGSWAVRPTAVAVNARTQRERSGTFGAR